MFSSLKIYFLGFCLVLVLLPRKVKSHQKSDWKLLTICQINIIEFHIILPTIKLRFLVINLNILQLHSGRECMLKGGCMSSLVSSQSVLILIVVKQAISLNIFFFCLHGWLLCYKQSLLIRSWIVKHTYFWDKANRKEKTGK